jgi:ribose transport system permease protein
LKNDFPALGDPRIITPRSYKWPNFLKAENLLNIANQIAVIAIVAIGMTMVHHHEWHRPFRRQPARAFRGAHGALYSRLCGRIGCVHGGMIVACLAAIVLCAIVGAFSGAMITSFDIPPFIVTLAMMLVGSGLAYILAKGQSIYQIPDSFVWLGRGADFLTCPTRCVDARPLRAGARADVADEAGSIIYAVGGNREAARLSGVPVQRVLLFAYVASALLAGLGGVIMASQLKSGSATYGNMYELYVIAAVVVGGTSLSGGEGKCSGRSPALSRSPSFKTE